MCTYFTLKEKDNKLLPTQQFRFGFVSLSHRRANTLRMRLLNIDTFVVECGEMLNLCKLLSAIQASFALFQATYVYLLMYVAVKKNTFRF